MNIYVITGIVTQGCGCETASWVEHFFVTYGLSGDNWIIGDMEEGAEKHFIGNFDANTAVTNIFSEPIYAKFFRVNIVSQTRPVALRFDLIGCKAHSLCLDDMGLKSGEIMNNQISSNGVNFNADSVRIGYDGTAWCLSSSDVNPTVTFIFQQLKLFTGIIFKLEANVDVSLALKFAHSDDNLVWKYVYIKGNLDKVTQIVPANDDSEKWVVFSKVVQTRIIRVEIPTTNEMICLRFELLGCKDSSLCRHSVGVVEDRIPSAQFTYSDADTFVMVDLLKHYTVTGVVVISMGQFYVEYSIDYGHFKTILDSNGQNEVFDGRNITIGNVVNSFGYPVVCRFLRLVHKEVPETSFNLTFYPLGCEEPMACQDFIKSDPSKTIYSSIRSMSNQDVRLFGSGWLSREDDDEPWVIVVLQGRHHISGIVTNCFSPNGYHTQTLYVAYGMDANTWKNISLANGRRKVFKCNNTEDQNDLKYNMFDEIFTAQYIKFDIISNGHAVFLKIGILGCKGTNSIRFTSSQPAVFPITIHSENMFSFSTIMATVMYTERIMGFRLVTQGPIKWNSKSILIAAKIFSGVYSSFELFLNELNYTTNTEIVQAVDEDIIFSVSTTTEFFNELSPLNITIRLINAISEAEDYIILLVQYEILDLHILYSSEYVATGNTFQIGFDMLIGSNLFCTIDLNDSTNVDFYEYIMQRDQNNILLSHVYTSPGFYDVSVYCSNNVSEMIVNKTIIVQNRITDYLKLECASVVPISQNQNYGFTVIYSFQGNSSEIPTDVFANYEIYGILKENRETYTSDVKCCNFSAHNLVVTTWDSYEINVLLYNRISSGNRQCYVNLEEVITDLTLSVHNVFAKVDEVIEMSLTVTWGSRMRYTIDFDDDSSERYNTSESVFTFVHSFDSPGTYYVTVNAENFVDPSSLVSLVIITQRPVGRFEVNSRYLNKLELNREGEPSYVVVPIDVYRDLQFEEATDAYFTIDFGDGTRFCPRGAMCLMDDVITLGYMDSTKDTSELEHILAIEHNYTIAKHYNIKFMVWNNVSSDTVEYGIEVFEEIQQLEKDIKFFDIDLTSMLNTSAEYDLFGKYAPLDMAIVVTADILYGTEVLFTWNFNDPTKPVSNYIFTTREPKAYYKYTNPGSYFIKVNASNPISSSTVAQNIFVQETVKTFQLNGFGPITMNSTVPFVLNLGKVATDACYRIDFKYEYSNPGRIQFYGSWSMCQSKYTEEFQNNPIFKQIDSNTLWIDVNYKGRSPNISISNLFYEYNKYDIVYEGFNMVSYINGTLPQVITKLPCYFPRVNVKSENECNYNFQCNPETNYRQYLASTQVKIQSLVEVNCSSTDLTRYHWKVFKIEGERETLVTLPPSVTTIGSGLRTLVLEPRLLAYGLYRSELNVTMLGGEIGLYTSDSTHTEIIPTPLIVEIVGGEYRTIKWKTLIQVDGLSLTFDPDVDKADKSGMEFTWMCRRSNFEANGTGIIDNLETFEIWNDNFTKLLKESKINEEFEYSPEWQHGDKGGCFGRLGGTMIPTPGGILNYTTGNITINTDTMYWNMEYELKLIVRKGSRRSEFTQTLYIVEGDPPDIQMACKLNCRTKKTPTNRFSLENKETNPVPGIVLFYIWEIYQEVDEVFEMLDGNEVQKYSGTGTNVSNLSIEPGLFEEKKRYRVMCMASRNHNFVNYGVSQLTFYINDIPLKGICSISPVHGVATSTEFRVQCEGFRDDDLPLLYKYSYSIDNGTNWFTFFNEEYANMTKGVKIPAGPEEYDYMVAVRVRVTDSYGSFVETKLNTTVYPLNCSEEIILAEVDGLGDRIRVLAGAGQTLEVSNIVSSTSSFLNYCSKLYAGQASTAPNISAIQMDIREEMILTLGTLQQAYNVEVLSLMASALQLATTWPNELTERARNESIHIASTFATTLQKVESPLAEDIEDSARLVFSSLGAPTKPAAEYESSATQGLDVITSVIDTMASTMVTGQKNIKVDADSMSVTVSMSFTNGRQNGNNMLLNFVRFGVFVLITALLNGYTF
ncbi:uncharacterized protein LOC117103671 [Anneissia japonica]|uniref:uncharacterized protein LOC117103671 n=1 Tax=Anneissia japonica TaxID=1529436 RepID=UPI001425A96B|nr:uncharacterized protein LOC117103671 [Anneissia japonica]